MKQKTKTQIIDETVEWYSNNPKATDDDGNCVYVSETGSRCAVGRCCDARKMNKSLSDEYKYDDAVTLLIDQPDILKSEYEGHESSFWLDLQDLHDDGYWWDGNTLSVEGIRRVEELKEKWK